MSAKLVSRCQACGGARLDSILFLGHLPPVNDLRPIGVRAAWETRYPAELLRCPRCELVQMGVAVEPKILFPPDYPYTSGTTQALRDNFAELARECRSLVGLDRDDLALDIGSNDGTLLSFFQNRCRVQGVEPARVGALARRRGIPTQTGFFSLALARRLRRTLGPAKLVTATNVLAHVGNVHDALAGVRSLLAPDGVFVSESHYLLSLLEGTQYDAVYHEHLRYYSLSSLKKLLERHGLRVIHARRIPTHGGSIRVYAAQSKNYFSRPSVASLIKEERRFGLGPAHWEKFRRAVTASKLGLHALLAPIKERGAKIYGVGAPSRATTLIHYAGIDEGILDCVLEVPGSLKLGKCLPGTRIPVRDERALKERPDYLMLLSWHLEAELRPRLRAAGFKGRFIIPLPRPRVAR